jgi:hypothetical protein
MCSFSIACLILVSAGKASAQCFYTDYQNGQEINYDFPPNVSLAQLESDATSFANDYLLSTGNLLLSCTPEFFNGDLIESCEFSQIGAPDIAPQFAAFYMVETDGTVDVNQCINQLGAAAPTIKVDSASFVQVIYNPILPTNTNSNYDAVAGKSASFSIKLTTSGFSSSSLGSVIVNILDGSGKALSSSMRPINLSDLSTGSYLVTPNMMQNFIPKMTLQNPISISFTMVGVNGVTANTKTVMSLNVIPTTVPKIGFVQIDEPAFTSITTGSWTEALPSTNNVNSILSTNTFLSSIYPVADNSIIYQLRAPVQNGFSPTGFSYSGGDDTSLDQSFAADEIQMDSLRRLLGLDRMIAIVPKTYFQSHGQPTKRVGAVRKPLPRYTAFVREDALSAVPHELSHTFGVTNEEYTLIQNADGTKTAIYDDTHIAGYDATSGQSYAISPNVSGSISAWSIMAPSDIANPFRFYWIDDNTYNTVFTKLSQPGPLDPTTVLVSGVLTKSGQFTFNPSLNLPNGHTTSSVPGGDLTVSALDGNGKVTNSVTIQSDFSAIVSYENGATGASLPPTIELSAMPVVIELPSAASISSLQVSQNGKILKTTSLGGQLLVGLISLIPDNAFKSQERCEKDDDRDGRPQTTTILRDRKLLNALVSRIQSKLNKGKLKGDDVWDAQELMKLLISEIKHLTYENYMVPDQSKLTQAQVIAQIKSIIQSLGLDRDRKGHQND